MLPSHMPPQDSVPLPTHHPLPPLESLCEVEMELSYRYSWLLTFLKNVDKEYHLLGDL